jgi:hypothetical protein
LIYLVSCGSASDTKTEQVPSPTPTDPPIPGGIPSPIPPPTKSSDILIDEALARNEISPQEALIEKTKALFHKELLQQQFLSDSVIRDGTPIINEITDYLNTLEPDIQSEVAGLMRLPVGFDFPDELEQVVDRIQKEFLDKSLDTEGGNFRIHYTETGPNAIVNRDYLERTAQFLEESLRKEITDLGYRAPGRGLNGKYDVYLMDINAHGIAWAKAIIIDVDIADSSGRINTNLLKATVVHEFFHTIQDEYDLHGSVWWREATATWMERIVYPDTDGFLIYRYADKSLFNNPELPLNSIQGMHAYSTGIFAEYLSQTNCGDSTPDSHGKCHFPEIIKKIFERMDTPFRDVLPGDEALAAIKDELESRGKNLEREFANFTVWNYFQDRYSGFTIGRGPALFMQIDSDTYSSENLKLDHLSSNYIFIWPGTCHVTCDELNRTLTISFNGQNNKNFAAKYIKVTNFSPIFQGIEGEINLDIATMDGTVAIDELGSKYKAVILIISNLMLSDDGVPFSFSTRLTNNPSPDETSPRVTIINPATESVMVNTNTINISGTALDNVGITKVSWTNDRGGSGEAEGTDNWSISNVTLQSGDNIITVTAVDAAGNTTSDTLTVTFSVPTPTPTPPPAAPTELSATVLSSDRINLIWKDNSSNETGFKIERKTGTGGTFSQTTTVGASNDTGASFEDTGLSASTTYCYRVKASNTAGDSSPSNEACATTNALPPILPTATTNAATNITSNSATLNATINGNGVSTGAFFDWGTNAAPPYGNLTPTRSGITSGTSNISFSENITNLLPNTTYRFRIVAANTAGGTTFGDTQTFTTAPAIGTRSLRLTVNGTGTISLSSASLNGTTSCSSTCTLTYNDNTTVTLTASPAGLPTSGTLFSRWDGCPNISGATCTIMMTADASVTANFSCFEVEPNGGSSSGTSLVNGTSCLGIISASGDVDWFRVGSVSSGTRIQFILAVPPGLDYELEVYGPSSSNSAPHFLCASRNGAGVGEKVVFTTTAPGTFYMRIFGANASHFSATGLYAVDADFPVSDTTLCGL